MIDVTYTYFFKCKWLTKLEGNGAQEREGGKVPLPNLVVTHNWNELYFIPLLGWGMDNLQHLHLALRQSRQTLHFLVFYTKTYHKHIWNSTKMCKTLSWPGLGLLPSGVCNNLWPYDSYNSYSTQLQHKRWRVQCKKGASSLTAF